MTGLHFPIEGQSACTGCGACALRCPKGCIEMNPDAEGFFRPLIDEDTCVDCGACAAVCPVNHRPELPKAPEAYAAYSLDESVRRDSSSGGVFTELAATLLARGGAVAGAALETDGVVRHIVVEDEAGLMKLRWSKYVQSEAWHVYAPIRTLLENGRAVLFTGTPCQAAGLAAYLGHPYERLVVADLICHGAPSPAVWKKYLDFRAGQAGAPLRHAEFRNKDAGWKRYRVKLRFENGGEYSAAAAADPYMRAFLKNASLRPSCHDCSFKGAHRAGDLTLADFWGVEKLQPALGSGDEGVSLVLVHTDKGARLLKDSAGRLCLAETEAVPALAENASYHRSSPVHRHRPRFFAELHRQPFDRLADRYCRDGFAQRLRALAGRVKRRIFR